MAPSLDGMGEAGVRADIVIPKLRPCLIVLIFVGKASWGLEAPNFRQRQAGDRG